MSVRCIQVDRDRRNFLAGRECIPTHNTTLFRQFAVCIAAGVHPFTHSAIEPQRVLVVDCENGAAHTRRKIRPLVIQAECEGFPVREANLWIEVRPEGLDLAADKDVSWLLRRIAAISPDAVMIGPLYRLAPRALNDDSDAAPVIATLNMIRARGASVLLEAHAGHALGMGGRRDLRPRGSSASSAGPSSVTASARRISPSRRRSGWWTWCRGAATGMSVSGRSISSPAVGGRGLRTSRSVTVLAITRTGPTGERQVCSRRLLPGTIPLRPLPSPTRTGREDAVRLSAPSTGARAGARGRAGGIRRQRLVGRYIEHLNDADPNRDVELVRAEWFHRGPATPATAATRTAATS